MLFFVDSYVQNSISCNVALINGSVNDLRGQKINSRLHSVSISIPINSSIFHVFQTIFLNYNLILLLL